MTLDQKKTLTEVLGTLEGMLTDIEALIATIEDMIND